MTSLDFLIELKLWFQCCPRLGSNCTDNGMPSNSELRRWLDSGAVQFNGIRLKSKDEVIFPITDLVFFPNKPNQTSIWTGGSDRQI